jgi:peptidoglycan/LPS O-acetylase OafA/YrhL
MAGNDGKIAFANSLRGIAAFMVMLAHYVVMFNYLKGAYGGFTKLPAEPFPRLRHAIYFWIPGLDYGALGVAIFFLVSGFVIPFSLDRYGTDLRGARAFFVARFYRLWPTYTLGVLVTIVVLLLIGVIAHFPEQFKPRDLFWQLTLYRDWVGGSREVTGVAWTLEVEAKFYLVCVLFGWALMRKPLIVFGAALIIAYLGGGTPYPDQGFAWSNFLFAPQFLSFMMIGTAFHHHLRGRLGAAPAVIYGALALAVFAATQPHIEAINYCLAVAIFWLCYVLRDRAGSFRPISFLADVSYPLYVVHPAFGYAGLRLMIGAGVPSPLALCVQIGLTLSLAYVIHRKVEEPTHQMGREHAKKIVAQL